MNVLNPGTYAAERLRINDSTWLVNIGTHKLPADDDEFVVLRESLNRALTRLLESEQIVECFFRYERLRDGRANEHVRRPEFRNRRFLGIVEGGMEARFEIERGTRTGRIDAHVVMRVYHTNRIQFDNNRFQELLDEELLVENRIFADENRYTRFPDKPLRWADPKLYVSFRLLGRTLLQNAMHYIEKQQNPNRRGLDESERAAIEVLASGFR